MILRAYGRAVAVHRSDPTWPERDGHFPSDPAARQVIDLSVDLVQHSCGYAVPLMTLDAERQVLADWAERKGPAGVAAYWGMHNAETIDRHPTHIAMLNRAEGTDA